MAVGNLAIDRLRLDEAFTGKMMHLQINECFDSSRDERLLVLDDDATKCLRFGCESDDVERGLVVINDQRREIVLLAIDNKMLKGIQGGIADCALFDDKQFRFVEFKTNAEGNAEKNFSKATGQLKNTIQVFVDRLQTVNIQFRDAVTLSCHVVLSHSFPRSQAIMQDFQIAFATDTDGIMLSFDSETQWEEPAESI